MTMSTNLFGMLPVLGSPMHLDSTTLDASFKPPLASPGALQQLSPVLVMNMEMSGRLELCRRYLSAVFFTFSTL
jgi:hypothetical protein